MNRGPDRGYFPEPAKSLFISDNPGQEEAAKREFAKEGLVLNFVSGSRYLGANIGPQEELEAWMKPQLEAWAHGVRVLAKIARRHPQSAYAGLGKYPRSAPLFINSFKSCALCRSKPSNAASSA